MRFRAGLMVSLVGALLCPGAWRFPPTPAVLSAEGVEDSTSDAWLLTGGRRPRIRFSLDMLASNQLLGTEA